MEVRVGTGLDVHAFAGGEQRPLVIGGVRVRDDGGLAGHSDADVLAHAVADALLGAAARGDLGDRFGVERPETEGADSMQLLAAAWSDVAADGWRVGNVDVTVVAQAPRLAPHRDDMRRGVAAVLGVAIDAVSVKFTTTDRLGSLGRGEGIACWAALTLQR